MFGPQIHDTNALDTDDVCPVGPKLRIAVKASLPGAVRVLLVALAGGALAHGVFFWGMKVSYFSHPFDLWHCPTRTVVRQSSCAQHLFCARQMGGFASISRLGARFSRRPVLGL